jgi:hypothetical protein
MSLSLFKNLIGRKFTSCVHKEPPRVGFADLEDKVENMYYSFGLIGAKDLKG